MRTSACAAAVGIHVVAHLSSPLSFCEQDDQPLDRRRERPRVRSAGLREQRDELGMGGEEVELRRKRAGDAVERPVAGNSERGECLLQLGGAPRQHRVEQPALGVEVVEQQLLVDTGPLGNLVHPRALEAVAGELVSCGRDDPYCPGVAELRLQVSCSQPAG